MKFLTLKNREVRIDLNASRYPIRSRQSSKSIGQFHLGQQLRAIYNGVVILEEFGIPDSRLSLDFFIPNRRLAFEFQGVQHDEYNPFFHETKADFERQKTRDADKRYWCEKNKITLIEVRNERITQVELKRIIEEEVNEQRRR